MSNELVKALADLEKERGIPKQMLIDAIVTALTTAYKKNYGTAQNVSVILDEETGDVRVFANKKVVDEVQDKQLEMALEEARLIDENAALDEAVFLEVTPSNFGRIAAQTAKQVVVQKLREAERGIIFEEFQEREGEIVTATIQRLENRVVIVNLGRTEGTMLVADQMCNEKYVVGKRIKTYIYEVKNTPKGPTIFVSRTHPNFLKRLFELEVPEIFEGLVDIKSIAREAGSRSKIAVYSKDDRIDPVGSCVGPRGIRVQNIVDELSGEKIDIIRFDNDSESYIANSLSPSKVLAVYLDEDNKAARVVVPDYQLSLAIGKEGQNARLAARLTGWKVDIKSESQFMEENEYYE